MSYKRAHTRLLSGAAQGLPGGRQTRNDMKGECRNIGPEDLIEMQNFCTSFLVCIGTYLVKVKACRCCRSKKK